MAITFAVDDVLPAEAPRRTFPLADLLGDHMALRAAASAVIHTPAVHPLLAAVHIAFAEHRPLVLSPDVIWLTIAQGVALHVNLHAEALRPRLVRHTGRERLAIETPLVPSTAEAWSGFVSTFRRMIAERVGEGRARLLTCDFSTTTDDIRVASEIVLMDVFASYYDFEIQCICGIPEVTLLGTPEDWRSIRRRIDVIAELDLELWTRSLVPIADQFVKAAEGQPEVAFWRDLYKPEKAYGPERITGWIARLFPYGGGSGRHDRPNPLLAYPIGEVPAGTRRGRFYDGPSITADWVPRGMSQVLVELRDMGAGCGDKDVILEGGLLGVEQDHAGRLAPVAGWLARPASGSTAALVARLREGPHRLLPVAAGRPPPRGSVELVTLYREMHAAEVFPGPTAWHLRPCDEHEQIDVPLVPAGTFDVRRVLDLPDGTSVCLADVENGRRWVRLRGSEFGPLTPAVPDPAISFSRGADSAGRRTTAQTAPEIPVLEGTLTEILTRALDTAGNTELAATDETLQDIAPHWCTPQPTKSPEELEAARKLFLVERDERRRKKQERQAELRARLERHAPPKPGGPGPGETG